jgi:Raf kinase inhibitor-like YbhB/YbcL family protein
LKGEKMQMRRILAAGLIAALGLMLYGCREQSKAEGKHMTLELVSSAFSEGDFIPAKYTGDGDNVSPPLKWTEPPATTKSFALVMDDPDAPMGTWVHWVIYMIPPSVLELPEGMAKKETVLDGVRQGRNSGGSIGYDGPAPPKGKPHRYYFKLYALDDVITLKPGASKEELMKAIQGRVVEETKLMGRYQRK